MSAAVLKSRGSECVVVHMESEDVRGVLHACVCACARVCEFGCGEV